MCQDCAGYEVYLNRQNRNTCYLHRVQSTKRKTNNKKNKLARVYLKFVAYSIMSTKRKTSKKIPTMDVII